MTEVQIDLLVPASMGGQGRRGARLGVHGAEVARKAIGLEAASSTIHAFVWRPLIRPIRGRSMSLWPACLTCWLPSCTRSPRDVMRLIVAKTRTALMFCAYCGSQTLHTLRARLRAGGTSDRW
jgi:hypothetical protein